MADAVTSTTIVDDNAKAVIEAIIVAPANFFALYGSLLCKYPLRVFSPAPMTDATATSTNVSISKGHRIVIYLRI